MEFIFGTFVIVVIAYFVFFNKKSKAVVAVEVKEEVAPAPAVVEVTPEPVVEVTPEPVVEEAPAKKTRKPRTPKAEKAPKVAKPKSPVKAKTTTKKPAAARSARSKKA